MNDELRLPAGAHEDALRWLNRALDGEISERERILLDDHLSGCPPCSTVASQLRAASSVLRADARSHPPVGLVDRILARIARSGEPAAPLAETGSSSRGLAVVRPLRWSAALAAGLLLCVGGLFAWQGPKTAVAANKPTLRTADAALMRVLDRWQNGRDAPPSFFELLLTPSAPPSAVKGR